MTRDRIQTGMLVSRLEAHVESKGDLLSPSQVTAAVALLRKTLPDLAAITLAGDAENPIQHVLDLSALTDQELRVLSSITITEK